MTFPTPAQPTRLTFRLIWGCTTSANIGGSMDQVPMINADEAGGGNFPTIVGDRVYYAINM